MFKSTLRSLITGAAAVAVSAMIAGPAFAQKTKITVYSALENDQLGPYKQAFETANPDVEIAWVRDSTGVITARILAEKDNPRADVIWGLGASSIALFDSMGLLEPLHAEGRRPGQADVPQQQEPDDLDRAGRVARGHVLQHGRRRQEEPAEAGGLGRSRQSRLQGLDRDAQSGLVGNGLPGGLRVDPDHGRKGGLGIHGQAAPEHRRVYALGFGALRAGGQGRARDRHRFRHARRQGKDRRRADRHHPGQGRRALGHGSHGDREGDQEPGRGAEARRFCRQQGRLRALRQVLRDRRLSRA